MTFFNLNMGNELYEEQAYRQLTLIAESKALRVKDFLDNRKADAIFLAESEDVRSIFDEEIVRGVGVLSEKVRSVAENAKSEIEEYLLDHPYMSVSDLQNDEVFQNIAVRGIGEGGFTIVGDMEADIVLFHKYPDGVGFDLREYESINLLLWEQYLDAKKFKKSFGFYTFEEADGSVRDQYHYTLSFDVAPKDGEKLFLTAISYVDEFGGAVRLASDLDLGFKSFQQKKGYDDLIFIDPEGDVIWTARQQNELGTNLVTGVYNESLLANMFNKAKKDLGVGISDNEAYGAEGKSGIFITAPVIEVDNITGKRVFLGIVALKLDGKKISELVTTDVGLRDAGEVYIINRDRRHITPLRFDGHGHVAGYGHEEGEEGEEGEEISSEGIDNCFKDYNNYYFALQGEDVDEVEKTGKYLDYAKNPNMVLGAHQYILESGWCVIAEMDEKYYLDMIPKMNLSLMINLLTISFLLLIASLLLDSFFKVRRGNK
jgi:hypothetical protein